MLDKFDSNSKRPTTPNATQEINEHYSKPILAPSAWGAHLLTGKVLGSLKHNAGDGSEEKADEQ